MTSFTYNSFIFTQLNYKYLIFTDVLVISFALFIIRTIFLELNEIHLFSYDFLKSDFFFFNTLLFSHVTFTRFHMIRLFQHVTLSHIFFLFLHDFFFNTVHGSFIFTWVLYWTWLIYVPMWFLYPMLDFFSPMWFYLICLFPQLVCIHRVISPM